MNEELKKELEGMLTEFKSNIPSGISKDELAIELKSFESKLAEKFAPADYSSQFAELKGKMIELEAIANRPAAETEKKSVHQAIVDFFAEKEVKTYADIKKLAGLEIELKADNEIVTTGYTGTISRTQEVSPVSFPRLRPTAFVGVSGIRTGVVENGKSVLLWTPAAYTSNAGYVGEFTAVANGNAATATEKTRKTAKLGAYQIITQETIEDLPQFAQRVEAKLMETIVLKFDELILSGAGNDSTKPTEIYGLKTNQMTAFDPTLVEKVDVKANMTDLVDACATQAEISLYMTNTVWLHPKKVNLLRRAKDSTGQYIINRLITGELVLGGHRVISNTGIGVNEMIVGDAAAIQIWYKRNFAMKFEDKPALDAIAMYVYLRAQVLVEDEDIKGLIYVSDVDAALAAITNNTNGAVVA